MRASKPKITIRKNPGGSISFCVDAGIINGKRPRKFFDTKEAAKNYAGQMQTAKKAHGALVFSLTARQQVEAAQAFRLLEPANMNLVEAVEYYLRHAEPKGGKRVVRELNFEFLEAKKNSGKKPRYIKELKCKLAQFANSFGDVPISEISRQKFEEWLNSRNFQPITKNNYLRDIGMLFKFSVARGYCAENIVRLIENSKVIEKPANILSVQHAVALLGAARIIDERLIPYISIGLFAGLRSSEIESLDWDQINLMRKTIEVTAQKAKTSRRRYVKVSENLAAWLKPHEKIDGPVAFLGWREKLQLAWKMLDIERWPTNCLRHSFGSYHYAKHSDASRTACEMGHSTSKMLFDHYREMVLPEEAEKFWNILPQKSAQWYFKPEKAPKKMRVEETDTENTHTRLLTEILERVKDQPVSAPSQYHVDAGSKMSQYSLDD